MSRDSLYHKHSYMYLQKEDLPAKRRKLHHPEYVITIEGINEEAGWESNDTVTKVTAVSIDTIYYNYS